MVEKSYKIVVDTREQNPFKFEQPITVKCLKTGDYSLEGFEGRIAIERKSLSDLLGTLTSGHKRFKRELQRALELDYFAIVIEGSLMDLLNDNYTAAAYSKMNNQTLAKIIFTIHYKYKIPLFFCDGVNEARNTVLQIFDAFMRSEL